MSTPGAGRIAVFVSGFASGGVPRVMTTLAHAFGERGHSVDLLAAKADGPALPDLAPPVRLVDLAADRWLAPRNTSRRAATSAPALARYLRRERPAALISGGNYPNLAAILGRVLARASVPLIISHHAHYSLEARRKLLVRLAARHLYPRADAIVAVSHGVAEDLARQTGIPPDRITTIYNPVARLEIATRARQPVHHPWFASGSPPVILGVGRLHRQKDFPTLVRAFALIRRARPAHLLILGEGKGAEHRARLLALAASLEVADDVDFPGFVANPFAYMARAGVFALSSAWEGLPTALIEALACGCPVVSTNCPSGPSEILAGGKFGPLVPVGDPAALARAILSVLDARPDPGPLRARAAEFSVESAAVRYLELVGALRSRSAQCR